MNKSELRLYTHKESKGDMFITDIVCVTDRDFYAHCESVKEHPHYSDHLNSNNEINPMFLLECARQIETAISHCYFKIDIESKFLLESWSFHKHASTTLPIEYLTAKITTKYSTVKKLSHNLFTFNFFHKDKIICEINLSVRFITSDCYHIMRGNKNSNTNIKPIPHDIKPTEIGYSSPYNIAIANFQKTDSKYCALISIPPKNTTYNDHALDHISGSNLTEVSKQLCYCYLTRIKNISITEVLINNIDCVFLKYTEKDEISLIVLIDILEKEDSFIFTLEVVQNNNIMAKITLIMVRYHG